MKKITTIFLVMFFVVALYCEPQVLFDNGHAQTAGSANWTINTGFSKFAHDIENLGYFVNSVNGPISSELLTDFNVLVIPEPNNPFSDFEIAAMKKFVYNGGGLFLIADHYGADRNNNGWDAVKIFNNFIKIFGFEFNKSSYSEHPINNKRVECSVMQGVNSVGAWGGTDINILDDKRAMGLICYSDSKGANPFVVVATYGKGRIAAIGDSSPIDDGTMADDRLYNNYDDFDDRQMAINLFKWCAKMIGNDLPIISQGNSNNSSHDDNNSSNNSNSDLVNINTATKEELVALPGIGDYTANLIIRYRNTHGPFTSIEQILEIPGIDVHNYKYYKDLITI